MEKVKLELKGEDWAVYNGTEWFLVSVDIQMSGQSTNDSHAATRRFRLYPVKSSAEAQPVIKPYTTGAVDLSDLSNWIKDLKPKTTNWEFVEAEGYGK